jgi:hypothetical protein
MRRIRALIFAAGSELSYFEGIVLDSLDDLKTEKTGLIDRSKEGSDECNGGILLRIV